jgi:universal stress protein A
MNNQPYVVLVGMDFSEPADRALAEALDLATRHEHAEIHVLTVISPPAPMPNIDASLSGGAYAPLDQSDPLDGALTHLTAHVQSQLQAFVARITERGVKVAGRVVSHVRLDTPSLGIAAFAAELGAQLIVVGTHNRRGMARLLLGSVAESTVRYARCPVLVVPPKAELTDVKIEPACAQCLLARAAPNSHELWCEQHRERHGRRHTYHQNDRSGGETNFPLVLQ